MNKFLIIGTGGVGGSIAGFLALAGKDVTCIARGKHLKAIREKGLHLKSDLKFRTILNIVFVFDDFGTDKAFFKVGMDDSGTLGSFPAFAVSPCFYFHFSGCDECFQIQQFVSCFNQTVDTRFFQSYTNSAAF